MDPIQNIALIGGCYGNQLTAIYLLQRLLLHPSRLHHPGLRLQTMIANTEAAALNQDSVAIDLNEQFCLTRLHDYQITAHETLRARQIHDKLGPKSNPKTDLIIELQTSTSHIDACVVFSHQGPFYASLATYLHQKMPDLKLVAEHLGTPQNDHPKITSVGKLGITFITGPVPNTVVRADQVQLHCQLTQFALDFVRLWNKQQAPMPEPVPMYLMETPVYFPLNKQGAPTALVHPHLLDQAFPALIPGEPMLLKLDGTTIVFEGDQVKYPIFINESRLYAKRIAFWLTKACQLSTQTPAPQPSNAFPKEPESTTEPPFFHTGPL